MLPLKNLIRSAVHRAGITTQVSSAQIVDAVNGFLDSAVLPELRSFVEVISFSHGTLKIRCQNSVASHEVRSLQSGIEEAVAFADPRSDLRDVLIQIHSARVL